MLVLEFVVAVAGAVDLVLAVLFEAAVVFQDSSEVDFVLARSEVVEEDADLVACLREHPA